MLLDVQVEKEGEVKQWGLLSWNKRHLTYGEGVIKLYKESPPPPGASPIVAFDLSQRGVSFEADPVTWTLDSQFCTAACIADGCLTYACR